jgi:cytoskeletal protein CcmA (bactofilin family)
VVVGHVSGNVSATERIEVQASGIVDGDVRAPRLVVQEGAVLNGAVEMGEVKRPAGAEPVKKAVAGGDSLP